MSSLEYLGHHFDAVESALWQQDQYSCEYSAPKEY